MNNKRIGYIDIARGLGMIAVIWGHIMLRGWSFVLAYAFDIPLFFFLSGVTYSKDKNDNLKIFMKRSLKKLIIPYFIFSFITWAFWAAYNILMHEETIVILKSLMQTFIAQGSGSYLLHNAPLWFVTCLFVVQLLYFFISKRNELFTIIMSIIFAAIGYVLVINGYVYLVWNIEAALSAIIFFSIGNILAERYGKQFFSNFTKRKRCFSLISYIATTLLFVVLALWNGHISLGSNDFGRNVIVLYIVGFLSIYSSLYFSSALENISNNFILQYIKWIGKNSFYFMSMHFPISVVVNLLVSKIFSISRDILQVSMAHSLISFTITMIITSIVVILINKFKEKTKFDFI